MSKGYSMLKIKNLFKQFNDRTVLNNVSLDAQKGSITVLLGASGVGKSTLLRILSDVEKADSGTIELDGATISSGKKHYPHLTGMVFQQFNLFDHLTVKENITLPLSLVLKKSPQEANAIADKLLKKYKLSENANAYPSQLSGGQKQRAALARALALKPSIICLDEPTSALDPFLTAHVATTIKELATDGYIVLVATHDISLLEKLPCTIHLMQDGSIIESASLEKFSQNKLEYPNINQFISS